MRYADIDGDGRLELFGVRQLWSWRGVTKEEILRKGSIASFFSLNEETNTWTKKLHTKVNNPEIGCVHPRAAVAGDFTGDDRVDFFVACHGVDLPPYPREANDIYIQNDDASFTISKPWPEIGFYHSVASADFNQDGILDVVVTNNMAGKGKSKAVLRVYLNRLTKGFRNALSNAQADGSIEPDINLDDLAAHFVNSVVGVSALLRANATPEQMYAAGRGATSMLTT